MARKLSRGCTGYLLLGAVVLLVVAWNTIGPGMLLLIVTAPFVLWGLYALIKAAFARDISARRGPPRRRKSRSEEDFRSQSESTYVNSDEFYSKIAGVSFRPAAVKKARQGDRLILRREPDNPHDKYAVALILEKTGEQLGYLNPPRAKYVASRMSQGAVFTGSIAEVTGGGWGRKERGLNIRVWKTGDVEIPTPPPAPPKPKKPRKRKPRTKPEGQNDA